MSEDILLGMDGSIGTIGILATPQKVEIVQANSFETPGAGKDVGVEFVHQPGNSPRGKWFANLVFPFEQIGVIIMGGAACGIDEALDLRIKGRNLLGLWPSGNESQTRPYLSQ
jgi:hypothetical protein